MQYICNFNVLEIFICMVCLQAKFLCQVKELTHKLGNAIEWQNSFQAYSV
jgi:hypothetical protein